MDTLRQLILSLKKSERRYLELRFEEFGRGDKDVGKRLFRALLKDASMDDKALMKQLKLRSAGALSTRKSDVLNRILRMLADYQEKKHPKAPLLREIAMVRVLGDRGMYKEAYRKLNRIEEKARNKYLFDVELLLVDEYRRLFFRVHPKEEWKEGRKRMAENCKRILNTIAQNDYYVERILMVNEWNSSPEARRSEGVRQKVAELLAEPGMLKAPDSIPLRYNFETIHRVLAQLQGDYAKEYEHSRVLAELMLSKQRSPLWGMNAELMTLALFMHSCASMKKTEDPLYRKVRQRLAAYLESHANKLGRSAHWMVVYLSADIVTFLQAHQFALALESATKVESLIKHYPETLNFMNRNAMCYHTASAHFFSGNSKAAIHALAPVMHDARNRDNLHYYHLCSLLELAIHLDDHAEQLVHSKAKSLSEHLRKLEGPHRFEKTFVSYVSRINRTAEVQRRALWEAFARDLNALQDEPLEAAMFVSYNLAELWIEPKIQELIH